MRAFIYDPPEDRAAGILAHGPRNRWVARVNGLALLPSDRVTALEGLDLLTPATAADFGKASLLSFCERHSITVNPSATKAKILAAIITAAEG